MNSSLLAHTMVYALSRLVKDDIRTHESIECIDWHCSGNCFFFQVNFFCSWSYDKTEKACLFVPYSNMMFLGWNINTLALPFC